MTNKSEFMKSVVLQSYNRNIIRAMLGLKVEEVSLPDIRDDELLIKVHAAPVNPSDIAFIQGNYNIVKTLPAIPGFEASGIVIDAGKKSSKYIGSKVSCFVQSDGSGTWAEFVVANVEDIILIKDGMDMDQAACLTVNPFTAYGMFDIAIQYESRAIIQNAAGGQVAAFMRKMAMNNGVEVIDIVRKQASATTLEKEGAKYVLVETEDNFIDRLGELSKELGASVAYDAVGGELSGLMFNALINDSELVVYGGLSGKPIADVNIMDVIFNNKIISGFNLMDWKSEISEDDFLRISNEIQDGFMSGIYNTSIRGISSLEEIVAGLRSYISDMSSGKLLIKP